QESEALCLVPKKHCAQVTVAKADFTVVGDRTLDAEGLETNAYGLGGLSRGLYALLYGDSGTHGIGPAGIFKGDRLDALHDGVRVKAQIVANLLALLYIGDTVLSEDGIYVVDSSLVTFK